MLARLLLVFSSMLLGCSAICLRDSDCMGNSACIQNRCLLIVSGDAGVVETPPPPSNDSQDDDDDGPSRDAGSGDASD